ncbi:MAG: hypothetical protein ACRC30_11925 [Clostridium sp.]
MSLIGMFVIGALIAGGTGLIVKFWESIANWLNTTVCDYIEKKFGYKGRQGLQRAVTKISKVMNKVRNTSVIYTKRDRLDEYIDKTTIVTEGETSKIPQEVLNKIEKGPIEQEFTYEVGE